MKIEEAIEEFCFEQIVRGNSEKTVVDYRQKLGRFCRFFGGEPKEVGTLTVHDCKQFYLQLLDDGVRSITAQSYVRSLRAFLKWLYLEEHISVDLCAKFRLPKAKRKVIDVLTDDELRKIFDHFENPGSWLDARNRVIISLMLDCGLRVNEVVTAELRHLHCEERYLIISGKGNKERIVAFGNQTKVFLEDYLSRSPRPVGLRPLIISGSILIHPNDLITGISRSTIQDLFRKIKSETGIARLHPHLLRHSFATRFLENGGDIAALKLQLGHTSYRMVQEYLHLCTKFITQRYFGHSPLDRL